MHDSDVWADVLASCEVVKGSHHSHDAESIRRAQLYTTRLLYLGGGMCYNVRGIVMHGMMC